MSEAAQKFSGVHLTPPLNALERGSGYLWLEYASIILFAAGMMLVAHSTKMFSSLSATASTGLVAVPSQSEGVDGSEVANSDSLAIDPVHQGLANRLNLLFASSKLLVGFQANALPGRVEIRFACGEVFPSGHATIMPAGEQELLSLAQEVLQVSRQEQVQIESYTDSLPMKKNSWMYPSNWELSGARAASVLRIFEEIGFPPEQLRFVGFGRTRLAAVDISSEGSPIIANQNLNRRMVIYVGKPVGL
jgi:flagellar motor protein MotB